MFCICDLNTEEADWIVCESSVQTGTSAIIILNYANRNTKKYMIHRRDVHHFCKADWLKKNLGYSGKGNKYKNFFSI